MSARPSWTPIGGHPTCRNGRLRPRRSARAGSDPFHGRSRLAFESVGPLCGAFALMGVQHRARSSARGGCLARRRRHSTSSLPSDGGLRPRNASLALRRRLCPQPRSERLAALYEIHRASRYLNPLPVTSPLSDVRPRSARHLTRAFAFRARFTAPFTCEDAVVQETAASTRLSGIKMSVRGPWRSRGIGAFT